MGLESKDKKHNKNTKTTSNKAKMIDDPRFSSVHSDPRFQKHSKNKVKVEIDSRFSQIFNKNFSSSSAPIDKRGRPRKQNAETALRHYYQIEEKGKKNEFEEVKRLAKSEEEEEEESESESESEGVELETEGSGSESSDDVDSSADSEDDEEEPPDAEVENVPTIEQETCRLAVVNLDWRHVRAVDLYVVLRSFLPKGGEIKSVSVYPSEFGIQCMKEEELHGPVGLFGGEKEDDDDDDEIDPRKLREYEQSKLRYYYAVVVCDTVATADYIYKACDGVEFERSSNVLDMRFIPDSMEFKHPPRDVATEAPPSYEGLDFHTKALQHSNIPISWDEDEPQRVKTLKRKFNADQLAELELKDYLASDDSESEEEEEEEEEDIDGEDQLDKKHKKRDKYIALIQSGDGSDEDGEEKGQDMEVTFNTGLEDLSQRILEKKKDKKSESVWDVALRKQHERKKSRKKQSKYSSEDSSDTDREGLEKSEDDFFVDEPSTEKGNMKGKRFKSDGDLKQDEDAERGGEASIVELELLLADDKAANSGLKGYNLKRKKAKGKKGKELLDDDKIPTVALDDDPRFSALFTSPLFALDPTDPQYKRSASYARQLIQKRHGVNREQLVEGTQEKPPAETLLPSDKGMNANERVNLEALTSKKEKYELTSLVRSVKMKSQQIQLSSKNKISEKSKKDLSSVVQSAKKTQKHK